MPLETRKNKPNHRAGISLLELIAAAAVLVMVMGFVTTLCFRVGAVWKDIRQHRVAVAELSNQLDHLTRMEPQQAQAALDSLKPSELSRRTLREPQLKGTIQSTELGPQITLQLNWNRQHPGKPVEMAAWISDGTARKE